MLALMFTEITKMNLLNFLTSKVLHLEDFLVDRLQPFLKRSTDIKVIKMNFSFNVICKQNVVVG